MFENMIHQIDCKNEWFLLRKFTAKFGLVFILTLTLRPEKYDCFYVKFSAESKELGLFF